MCAVLCNVLFHIFGLFVALRTRYTLLLLLRFWWWWWEFFLLSVPCSRRPAQVSDWSNEILGLSPRKRKCVCESIWIDDFVLHAHVLCDTQRIRRIGRQHALLIYLYHYSWFLHVNTVSRYSIIIVDIRCSNTFTNKKQTTAHSHRIIYYYCTHSIFCFCFWNFRLKDLLPSLEFDRFAFMPVAFQLIVVFVVYFITSIEWTVSMLKCIHELEQVTVHSLNCK